MTRGSYAVALLLVLLCVPLSFAATSQEPILVRVNGYDAATRTYTFTCDLPPGSNPNRYWTVRPDTADLEASFYSTSSSLTYNLTQNVLYHIGCQAQNASGQTIRGDFHIDRRTGPNVNVPDVKALAVLNNTAVTFQCAPPANVTHYNLYWTILSINGQQSFPALNNRNIVNITIPTPLLWDIDCGVWDIDRNQWMQWGYPVEYFPDSVPYFPTVAGCIPGEACPWANQTNTTGNTTGNQTNATNTTICYTSVQNIPAVCTGGTIILDTFDGCRHLACASGGNSVVALACDKTGFFEMYRQSVSGSAPKICLGTTCIQNNGYAASPGFPVCISAPGNGTGNQTNQTNGTNLPPLAPGWYEPSGLVNVSPYDFHIHITPMQDPENDTHVATDFEIWDVAANQRVWRSLNNTVILVHIHNADGTFEGNLAGLTHLLFNRDYQVRARVYARIVNGTIQTSPWSDWRAFHTRADVNLSNSSFIWTARPGYTVDLVASNISVPVNVFVVPPNLYQNVPASRRPLLYVTQLYGQLGVIRADGSYSVFAGNLLNYQSFGSLPGSGETGVDGLYVDNATGYIYISLVEANASALNGFQGKVMRFVPNASGDGPLSNTTILNGITVVPSHHVHTITRGPDGKLYLSTGDAFQEFHTRDPAWTNGKILRFNEDGSIPADNPVPGSYMYAGGFRNPFGTAWRPGTNELWTTNNGEDSNDGVYVVHRGDLFGWCNVTCDTLVGTIWHWFQTVAPTQIVFNPGTVFNDTDSVGSAFVALSGETYSPGPSDRGAKSIVEIHINPDGTIRAVDPLVTYTGTGYGAPIGLSFGNQGLYFSDIYGELGFVGVGQTRGNIFLVHPGTQTLNATNTTNASAITAGLGPAPWYPQGLNMIWVCAANGGTGNYTYQFTFGDGQGSPSNYPQNNIWHTYAANGTYNASCTATDTAGHFGSAATSIVLGTTAQGNQTNTTGNTTGNQTNATNATVCYSSVQTIPAVCTGGIVTSDTWNGGRSITCAQGGNSVSMTAWDKPDNTFEMNRGAVSGIAPRICLGTTCIQNNGFAKSPPFPICLNGTNQTPPADTTPPVVSNLQPTGTLASGTATTTLGVTTNEAANCRFSTTAGVAFASMNPFAVTGGSMHTTSLSVTDGQSYSYYVKCRDLANNTNAADALIAFSVANPVPPAISATLSHAPWFPQGRNTVLVCNATGFAPTAYDFTFGDGQSQTGSSQNNVWHTYNAGGAYTANCTARNATTSVSGALSFTLA